MGWGNFVVFSPEYNLIGAYMRTLEYHVEHCVLRGAHAGMQVALAGMSCSNDLECSGCGESKCVGCGEEITVFATPVKNVMVCSGCSGRGTHEVLELFLKESALPLAAVSSFLAHFAEDITGSELVVEDTVIHAPTWWPTPKQVD